MGFLVIYDIQLSADDLNLIGQLIDEQPYKRVHDLCRRIQAQITEQDQTRQVAQREKVDAFIKEKAEQLVAEKAAAVAPAEPKKPARAKRGG